ncbi:hypothetical protein E3N88_32277 [Mikania micrantha]|uniref:Uncharacterized protein n=1 Tax=Mikania micrantha TaxID=192012 RepID=A0A5N6MAP3_9ASTR|nr:hypothetical protein E3N88_32277 [Mikania micrantha]
MAGTGYKPGSGLGLQPARPGFQKSPGSTSAPNSYLSPIPITENGMLPADYVVEDPDSHFIYVCTKVDKISDLSDPLTVDI